MTQRKWNEVIFSVTFSLALLSCIHKVPNVITNSRSQDCTPSDDFLPTYDVITLFKPVLLVNPSKEVQVYFMNLASLRWFICDRTGKSWIFQPSVMTQTNCFLLLLHRSLPWQTTSQPGNILWRSWKEMGKIGLKLRVGHTLHPLPLAPLPHPLLFWMERWLCCVLMLLTILWIQYLLLHQVNSSSVLRDNWWETLYNVTWNWQNAETVV